MGPRLKAEDDNRRGAFGPYREASIGRGNTWGKIRAGALVRAVGPPPYPDVPCAIGGWNE